MPMATTSSQERSFTRTRFLFQHRFIQSILWSLWKCLVRVTACLLSRMIDHRLATCSMTIQSICWSIDEYERLIAVVLMRSWVTDSMNHCTMVLRLGHQCLSRSWTRSLLKESLNWRCSRVINTATGLLMSFWYSIRHWNKNLLSSWEKSKL